MGEVHFSGKYNILINTFYVTINNIHRTQEVTNVSNMLVFLYLENYNASKFAPRAVSKRFRPNSRRLYFVINEINSGITNPGDMWKFIRHISVVFQRQVLLHVYFYLKSKQ